MDRLALESACRKIADHCDTLDFPFFASHERKQALLQKQKEEIDRAFDLLSQQTHRDGFMSTQQRNSLWAQASADARKEFRNLDEKQLINGFYLQEVTRRYAELQTAILLQDAQVHP